MKTNNYEKLLISIAIFHIYFFSLSAQVAEQGSSANRGSNILQGNSIRTTFYNTGLIGAYKGDFGPYGGEWPKNSGHVQIGNISPFVMSEVQVIKNIDAATNETTFVQITPVIWSQGWDPNMFPKDSLGKFLGFEPLPNYLDLTQLAKDPKHSVAMSDQPNTWPSKWNNHWQGLHGNSQIVSDQESYFAVDDYGYTKTFKGLKLPRPVSTEPQRGGLGLQMNIREMQWADTDLQDILFIIYDIKNKGELHLPKSLFGINVGAIMGASYPGGGSESTDDLAKFYRNKNLMVTFDSDNRGANGYTPVPWLGFSFLETPGNSLDGIDNDGDADTASNGSATGRYLNPNDFAKQYSVNDPIVVIDYSSPIYKRTVTAMPEKGVDILYFGQKIHKNPNVVLLEIARNGIDDNLNGLIDESDDVQIPDPNSPADSFIFYRYIQSSYNDKNYRIKDYFTGEGFDNPNIDEIQKEGLAGSGDEIGISSFKTYEYGYLTYSNDELMWNYTRPGKFENKQTGPADNDYLTSTGFFPLQPKTSLRIVAAVLFAYSEKDLFLNLEIAQKFYSSNFTSLLPPQKPTVTSTAGNQSIRIDWDDLAELSYDPYLKKYDFEGYKVYKSEKPSFTDADGKLLKPIAVFDKIDSVFGYFPGDFGSGDKFFLGTDSGLSHSFLDSDVKNGIPYFYAVTAYDKGDVEKNIAPKENTVLISLDSTGFLHIDQNIVRVFAGDSLPAITGNFDFVPSRENKGYSEAFIGVSVLSPDSLDNGDNYRIQFLDVSMDNRDNDFNGLTDSLDQKELLPNYTTGVVLQNLTKSSIDTTWIYTYRNTDSKPELLRNLYDDSDGDPRTFTFAKSGLLFYVKNPANGIYDKSSEGINKGIRWFPENQSNPYPLKFDKYNSPGFKTGSAFPRQYKIIFSDQIADTSTSVKIPLASGSSKITAPSVPVNFKVYDLQTGEKLKFGFIDFTVNNSTAKGHYSAKDRIVFYEELSDNSIAITYHLLNSALEDTTYFQKNGRYLGTGDTLYLYASSELSGKDVYSFELTSVGVNENQNTVLPQNYALSQNYPNPFNPSTVINYQIPVGGLVKIKIYDLLGREISTLVNEIKPAGNYKTVFNAVRFSSGVYFYRMESGSFTETRKLIYIR